ncbi:hypothetical protein H0Z13_22165 [Klebsiella aerogenes]|uniref:hypothetical protein n=1 Tax=Klebsiella aerogenes TaxID=548 RepID=UPI0021BBA422|nr:hypothetical protein [Klebsiella aerogenes]MCT8150520.1 hypothetical protein [Klebsiella aerogenes]
MRKRERSNIVRIEKAARATKRKFTTTLKDYARESIPGELITTVREYPAAVPTGSEFELLQDVLSSTDNVIINHAAAVNTKLILQISSIGRCWASSITPIMLDIHKLMA